MQDNTCDICKAEYKTRYEVRTPRPSDHTDMCCVMWICEACAKDMGPARVKTAAEWEEWMDNEGVKQGFVWLS